MAAAPPATLQRDTVTGEIWTAIRHSFIYGIGGLLTKAISFVMLPVYTHYLTPKDYGTLEILDLAMSLLGMFVNMGFTAAFLKHYASAESEQEKRKVVSSSFFFVVGTGLGMFLLGSLAVHPATVLLIGPNIPSLYLFLSFGGFILGYIANVPYQFVRAKEQSGRIVTLDTLGTGLLLGTNIYFIVVLKLSILGILLSYVICCVVKTVVLLVWMAPSLVPAMDWKKLRRMLGFGAPLVVSNLTMFTLNFSDRFFLQRFQSLEAVGIYSVSYKVGFMLNFLLVQQFNMMWQARMYIVHRSPEYRRIFTQIFVLYSLILIFAALGLSLFSPEVMGIMVDRRYAAGQRIIPIVALAYVFLGTGYYLQLGMYLTSRTGYIGVVSVIAAALNLILNFVLVRSIGMMGAAWATLAAFLVLAAGSYYFSERVCPLGLGVARSLRALGWAVALYLLSTQVHLPPVALAIWKIFLLMMFMVLVKFSGVLSADEINTLASMGAGAVRGTTQAWKTACAYLH